MICNTDNNIVDIEVADIPIRINFGNSNLQHEFIKRYPFIRKSLNVHSNQIEISVSKTLSDNGMKGGWKINGEDQYHGFFDPEERKGIIVLTNSYHLESFANFLRQIYSRLIIENNGLVLHSASIIKENNAYIFIGKSKAGKSTVCAMSSTDTVILNDDLSAIKKSKDSWRVWSMPTIHMIKDDFNHNSVPIKAAFLLIKDTETYLKDLSSAISVARALAIPADQLNNNTIVNVLKKLADFISCVPCYEMHFQKNNTFWSYIEEKIHDKHGTNKI